jgi:hypothetical protein
MNREFLRSKQTSRTPVSRKVAMSLALSLALSRFERPLLAPIASATNLVPPLPMTHNKTKTNSEKEVCKPFRLARFKYDYPLCLFQQYTVLITSIWDTKYKNLMNNTIERGLQERWAQVAFCREGVLGSFWALLLTHSLVPAHYGSTPQKRRP